MSTLVELISVLAWPTVTVWFIKKYGEDVRNLILRISKLKMGAAEAEFAENLSVVEFMANESQEVKHVDLSNGEDAEFVRRLTSLQRIADVSPRAAITESWLMIEEAAAKSGFVQGASIPRVNPGLFIDWLVKDGKISKSTAKLIEHMKILRNEAVHLSDFEITREEAERYMNIAARVSLLLVEPESELENI